MAMSALNIINEDFARTNHQDAVPQVTAMHEIQSALNIINDQTGVYQFIFYNIVLPFFHSDC